MMDTPMMLACDDAILSFLHSAARNDVLSAFKECVAQPVGGKIEISNLSTAGH